MFLESLWSRSRFLAQGFLIYYLTDMRVRFKYNALRFRSENANACLHTGHTKGCVLSTAGEVCGRVVWLLGSNPALFDGILTPSWPFSRLPAKLCQFKTEVPNRDKIVRPRPASLIWLTFEQSTCTCPNSSWILNEMLPVQDNLPNFVEINQFVNKLYKLRHLQEWIYDKLASSKRSFVKSRTVLWLQVSVC